VTFGLRFGFSFWLEEAGANWSGVDGEEVLARWGFLA